MRVKPISSLRQKAKKMLKLIVEIPPSFSVYGMWSMDARALLGLFQIVTSTYVLLLQFNYL
ncbi:hypothetical protein MSG28_001709 [Choristoneura fumiferana]|uniref:Uncharacterized protein n=1 Tax=Choristoneura fumiferana TaxID=7141 RepID=A0ACC0KUV7_CHOFU|nr:hypothetical protein MSG28_001709 [Choristoneura fumiferana]